MIEFFEKLDASGIQGLVQAQLIFAILFFAVSALYIGFVYRIARNGGSKEGRAQKVKKRDWNAIWLKKVVLRSKESLIR